METDSLPFVEIPAYPDSATAGAVVARMIDGLGYRYYWATEGLRAEDLAYRTTPGARSLYETLQHIAGLCDVVRNVGMDQPSIRPLEDPKEFMALRKLTLQRLADARESFLRIQSNEELEAREVLFVAHDGTPRKAASFWHLLNGPLADALWHTGQVVTLRRASGNPLPTGVSVFMGKTRR